MIVAFREVAEAELEAASDVYSALNPELGRRFLAEVDLAVSLAAENPKAYAIVDADIRHVRLRRFPHALYFRVVRDVLVVLALFHPARDPSRLLRRS